VPKKIENYRKISKSIENRKALRCGVLQAKSLIFCAFRTCVAAYTGKDSHRPHPIDNGVLFVQVLDSSKLKDTRSKKPGQWTYIQQMIQDSLKNPPGKMAKYSLFHSKPLDFQSGAREKDILGRLGFHSFFPFFA
jgi:hypothetical protein